MLSGEIDDYAVYAFAFQSWRKMYSCFKRCEQPLYKTQMIMNTKKICRYIYETVNAKKVIIWYFFPIIWIYGKCKEYVYGKLQLPSGRNSFTAGEDICGNKDYINIYIATQRNGMNEEDREQFLKLLKKKNLMGPLIGMCVTGGDTF